MVKFSEDEMKVTVGGHRYKAVLTDGRQCGDCVFKLKFGCTLAEEAFRDGGVNAMKGSRCMDKTREDGRQVRWYLDI